MFNRLVDPEPLRRFGSVPFGNAFTLKGVIAKRLVALGAPLAAAATLAGCRAIAHGGSGGAATRRSN
jgi:hypothetical protein